jgi:hypothetical protein
MRRITPGFAFEAQGVWARILRAVFLRVRRDAGIFQVFKEASPAASSKRVPIMLHSSVIGCRTRLLRQFVAEATADDYKPRLPRKSFW